MGENQFVFNAREITHFQMGCLHQNCQTMVTFNGAAPLGPSDTVHCPNCGRLMSGVAEIADAYRLFLRLMKDTDRAVQFVVTVQP